MSLELNRVIERLDEVVEKNFVNTRGEPVKLAPYQREIIKSILKKEKKRILVLASTRVGKTESVIIASILSAILYPGEEVVVVASRYEQAMGIFKRIRNNFWSNPRFLNLVDLQRGFRAQEIVLKNGSTLRFLNAGGKESLLSWGATFLIVDEFASIPADVLRTRILRMTGGSGLRNTVTVLLGTPHNYEAVADWIYDEDVKLFTVTWKEGVEAGILNKDEVEYYKKKLPKDEFEVWFEAKLRSPTDAYFDLDLVKNAMTKKKEEHVPEAGYLYFAGCDIARYGNDLTVIAILKMRDDGASELVKIYERGKRSLSETGDFLVKVVKEWGIQKIGIDTSPLGAGLYDFLKASLGDKLVSVNMSSPSIRTLAYNSLRSAIEEGRLILLDRKDLLSQFATFKASYDSFGNLRVKKGSGHNDIVDALAIALVASERRGGRVSILEGVNI